MLKASGAIGLLGALPVFAYKAGTVATFTPPARSIPREYFGMHMHRASRVQPWYQYGKSLTPWPSARFGSWRLWDAYVAWPNLQPERAKWDFSLLDRYVAMAELAKVEVLLPLGLSPRWASARPDEKSSYGPGNAAEPRFIEDWRAYVETVAVRYKGRIRLYELWNEPNLPGFFTGGPDKLMALAREAYSILKKVDSSNLLAAPATTGDHKSLAWLDRYLSIGGGKHLDILSHHFYVAQGKPEDIPGYVQRVKKIASGHGLSNVPLWNTESGFWIQNLEPGPDREGIGGGWRMVPSELAAAYVVRSLVLGWAAGLDRYYWYSWDHGNMGLTEPSSQALKAAGRAYARAIEWLAEAIMTSCRRTNGIWRCDYLQDGQPFHVIWLDDVETPRWISLQGWNISALETLDGAVTPVSTLGDGFELGTLPVRLVGQRT